jgi:hypothetical protein
MRSLAKRSLRGTFVTAIGLAVLLPSVAQASVGTASGGPLQRASESAASHERSVHVVATTTGSEVGAASNALATIAIITDAARTEGIQHLTFEQGGTTGHEVIEVVGGIGYFKGDALTLQSFNGFTASAATRYAGMWLKVTKSDAAFSKVTSGVTMSTLPSQLNLPHPQLLSGLVTVVGYRVKELRAVFAEPTGTVTGTLYVRSHGAPLPVEETFVQTGGAHGSDVLTNWNERMTVTPPTSSIPFSATGQ